MAKSAKEGVSYKELSELLANGQIGNFYIFHGEERYLLERCLAMIRKSICPTGLDGFNYKRFGDKNVKADELAEAIDTFPAFADRTLIEINDFDIFKSEQKPAFSEMLSNLPDYVCIVIVYDTIIYKPDGRVKLDKEILKSAQVVEFAVQDQVSLTKWIKRHCKDAGKLISSADAGYLVAITGGYMSSLHSEIEKVTAYALGEAVTRADIDAVVTPILDTVAYKLTDALMRRDHISAMRILDELFQMREAPHKLIYSISLKMRQLLAARVCIESKLDKKALIDMCDIRYEFQAKALMDTARNATLNYCFQAVLFCANTAYELNSSSEPESRLVELLLKLAFGL
ncbi:MAG: DNA polymerase III subunit delta [Oscillospiraceae bacterium]|nr:DNA polymerase III subunit delta [Oscillospiraceae bacterium]